MFKRRAKFPEVDSILMTPEEFPVEPEGRGKVQGHLLTPENKRHDIYCRGGAQKMQAEHGGVLVYPSALMNNVATRVSSLTKK